MKRPSFQFYPGDWMRDTALRSCSVAARGLWMEMICLMHEGSPYGHLKVNNKVIDVITLSRMAGVNTGECETMISELENSGVVKKTSEGVWFSKRMVEDERIRTVRSDGGKKGGNPDLGISYNLPGFVYLMSRASGDLKIGISASPEKRAYKIRKALHDDSITVVAKKWVTDMGYEEAKLHTLHAAKRIDDGEWFRFDNPAEIIACFHLKENSSPSSPSSPSPSGNKIPPADPKPAARAKRGEVKANGHAVELPNPEHGEFIRLWCEKYPEYHAGEAYAFQAGRDGKAVKDMLAMSKKSAIELMKMAIAAWKEPTGFNTKTAASINGMASKFNEIRSDLNAKRKIATVTSSPNHEDPEDCKL